MSNKITVIGLSALSLAAVSLGAVAPSQAESVQGTVQVQTDASFYPTNPGASTTTGSASANSQANGTTFAGAGSGTNVSAGNFSATAAGGSTAITTNLSGAASTLSPSTSTLSNPFPGAFTATAGGNINAGLVSGTPIGGGANAASGTQTTISPNFVNAQNGMNAGFNYVK